MKIIINILLLPLLFLGVFASQYFFDINKEKQPKPSPYVLGAEVVEASDLGLDSAASSLYWLSAIQYYGDWQEDEFIKLIDYIKLSTDLDPKFSYPYAFGALMLPSLGYVDESIEIAKKGVVESDPDWRIPYYLATTYFINKDDQASAAKYFAIAADTKGAPESIIKISATFGSNPNLREQTKQIWTGIMETSDDEVVRERAEAYVYHYEILDLLEEAGKIYFETNNRYPDPLDELVNANILKAIPNSPFGFEYYVDEEGRARIKSE